MKKLLTLAALMFVTVAASAQITWSVKGGVGLATCTADDGIELENKLVGRLGVGVEKPFAANWSLMPSLELAAKGCKFDGGGDISVYYLQLPVLAAYRFNLNDSWNLTVKAGPYFAFGMFGNISDEYGDADLFDVAERFDYGLDLGVDFEYHQYVFGLEYEYGLANINKEGGDVKNAAFFVTAGYKF